MEVVRTLGTSMLVALFAGAPAACLVAPEDIQGPCTTDTECDDGNPCTDDTCAADGFCDHDKPDSTPCGLGGVLECADGKCKCQNAGQCGVTTECVKFECTDGACSSTSTPKNTPVDGAGAHDCKKNVCDGAGNTETLTDDQDFPPDPTAHDCKKKGCDPGGNVVDVEDTTDSPADDGDICTKEGCDGSTPIDEPTNEGMACGAAPACAFNGTEYETSFAHECSGGRCLGPAPMSCGLFSCNGEGTGCRTSCQLDAHCIATAYCDMAAMVCGPKLDSGQMCPLGSRQCKSGSCADGVCCDKACNALCESCLGGKTGGIDGTCAFILAGTDPDSECNGSHTCDGNGGCD